jgi:hypothetical protein
VNNFGVSVSNGDTATPAPGETSAPFYDAGVYGQSGTGTGVYGVSLENTGTAVNYDSRNSAGVFGFGNDGPGLEGYSNRDFGVYAQNNSTSLPTLFIENQNGSAATGIAFYAYNDVTGDITIAYSDGNFYTSGNIQSGTEGSLARTRNPGTDMTTYSAQHTEDTVEDFGSGQLVGGVATIPLSSDFRQTINTALPYMVFLTPYGDNHGLYIASRSAAGFVVKEAQSGRSTLSFDYRIVARPYGAPHPRLPHMVAPPVVGRLANRHLRMFANAGNGAALQNEHTLATSSRAAMKALQHPKFSTSHIPVAPARLLQFTTR